MKIVGILVLLLGLLFTVVGIGGAAANFLFPPKELVCEWAERDFKKADDAVKAYEKAKGTDGELAAKALADQELKASQASSDACGRAKDSHRFYGFIFVGVAVVGFFLDVVGIGFILLGFRKKKA